MISIDFETFSTVDLSKAGVYRYAEDPTTEILCMAWAVDDKDVQLWIAGTLPPTKLFDLLPHHMIRAWNAQFELHIWNLVAARRMGWPTLTPSKFIDTMADAQALALPGKLETCGAALGVAIQKDAAGGRLIKKLCCPVKPSKAHPSCRWTKEEAHADYLALYEYCKQDVRAERAIAEALPFSATEPGRPERDVWLSTVHANTRGIPVDHAALAAVNELIEEKLGRLNNEIFQLSGGKITGVRQKAAIGSLVNELEGKVVLPNMQGPTLEWAYKGIKNATAKKIVHAYLMSNYASAAKFKRMAAQLCSDKTIKGNHQYHGASTGRDAGRGVQIQNLPRLSVKDPDFAIDTVIHHNLDEVETIHGNVLELASALCRPVLAAPPGYLFFNADLSQIEARMCAWVTGEHDILQAYRDGLDAYKVMAATMYHSKYDTVTKNQRQAGKIASLACQFQGGAKALLGMAANYGITFKDKEAQEIVNAFRNARPKLTATWRAFGAAAANAIKSPMVRFLVETNEKFSFFMSGQFLHMLMPNQRLLTFPFPEYKKEMMPWGEEAFAASAMWVNSVTGKWERRVVSGASFMQSAVQGLSRDILMEANLRVEKAGYPVIFRVHDELTSLVPDTPEYDLDHFSRVFTQVPEWCKDLPIECDPWMGKRYRK